MLPVHSNAAPPGASHLRKWLATPLAIFNDHESTPYQSFTGSFARETPRFAPWRAPASLRGPAKAPLASFLVAWLAEFVLRNDPGWKYESTPFRVWAAAGGRCPAKSLPVFRLYNGRAAQNDSNHRYTSRSAIVDQMVASGWKNEGVTFCIPQR